MLKGNLKLAPPPAREPQRAALAEAIERRAAAEGRLAEIELAIERATAAYNAALDVLIAAEKARDAAKQNAPANADIERALAEFGAEGPAPGLALEKAAAAVEKADAEVTRLFQLRDGPLKKAKEEAERELSWRRSRVAEALRPVIAAEPAMAALVERYWAARHEMERLMPAMRLLAHAHGPSAPDEVRRWNLIVDFGSGDLKQLPAISTWLAALETDADAAIELPEADAPLPPVA